MATENKEVKVAILRGGRVGSEMVLEKRVKKTKGLQCGKMQKVGVRDGVSEVPAPNTCPRNEKCSIPLCAARSFEVENEKSFTTRHATVVMVSVRDPPQLRHVDASQASRRRTLRIGPLPYIFECGKQRYDSLICSMNSLESR